MRHFIRLIETASYPVLYHGTAEKWREDILRSGLLHTMDVSYTEFGPGVYLTDLHEVASNYGPLVLAIDMTKLNSRLLSPDDYELRDYFEGAWGDGSEGGYRDDELRPTGIFEASWEDSLRICNQCKYLGDIPPTAIKIVDQSQD